jgi:hypothetical protein
MPKLTLAKSSSNLSKEKDLNPPYPSTVLNPSLILLLNQTLSF